MEHKNGTAIASLVLGIIAVVGIFLPFMPGWLVLVLGIVGLFLAANGMKSCPAGVSGHGMAIAGLVLNIVAVALSGVVLLCACAGCVAFTGMLGAAASM